MIFSPHIYLLLSFPIFYSVQTLRQWWHVKIPPSSYPDYYWYQGRQFSKKVAVKFVVDIINPVENYPLFFIVFGYQSSSLVDGISFFESYCLTKCSYLPEISNFTFSINIFASSNRAITFVNISRSSTLKMGF